MKHAIALVALFGLIVVGCQKKATSSIPANDSVTDISSPSHAGYQPAAPAQPVAAQPVVYDSMNTQPPGAAGAATAGGTYTIQKGDTLYNIARQRYGDGKQWQKIASANPGVDPTRLRIGQTITVP